MSDRELLELAAKAASQPGGWIKNEYEGWFFWQKPGGGEWNPLTDDGEALRLAVKLRLTPMMRGLGCDTTDSNGGASAYEKWGAYPFAAARRAIVRAAAEIGRQMQEGGAA